MNLKNIKLNLII